MQSLSGLIACLCYATIETNPSASTLMSPTVSPSLERIPVPHSGDT